LSGRAPASSARVAPGDSTTAEVRGDWGRGSRRRQPSRGARAVRGFVRTALSITD
jgi:hypothetical protein